LALINFSHGFTAGTLVLLGSAKLNGTSLLLTDGGSNEAAAAFKGGADTVTVDLSAKSSWTSLEP
jgi:hypothetical protein